MRVLLVNSMFVNRFYRRCADELGALPNVELTVFTPDSWRMNGGVLPLDPLVAGSPYGFVSGKALWKGFENRGFYISGLFKAFLKSKPDVIYLMEEPFSLFALQILILRSILAPNIPVVIFTWNNLSLDHFDYRPSFFYRTLSRWTLPKCAAAVTANTDAIQILRDAGFDRNVTPIGYGVDTKEFSEPDAQSRARVRASLSIPEGTHVIGFVGRLKYMKGVDLLVEAFERLRRYGTANVALVFVGGGEYESVIKEKVAEKGIGHSVRFVSTLEQHEIPAYMQALDTLVLPSRRVGMWAEQFGRVLIEAMAAGKIVVGSTSGAIPEVIGDAGFTFIENDVEDLFRVLSIAVSLDAETRSKLSQVARERAHDEFSWKRFAERSLKALTQVLPAVVTSERVRSAL